LLLTGIGLVFFALFILNVVDARTGIEGIFFMMMAFQFAWSSERSELRKRLTALEKEIKELKNNK